MKVTIIDQKQKKPRLTIKDLSPGTLFEMHPILGGHYIGLLVSGDGGRTNHIIRLNGRPVYAIPIENSWHPNEEVTIIDSVELSTE